jgi:FkbM family methyltransferase
MTKNNKALIGRAPILGPANALYGKLRDYFHGFFQTKAFAHEPLKAIWRAGMWVAAEKLGVGSIVVCGERFDFRMRLPVSSESVGSRGFYLLRDYYDPVWEQLDKLIGEGDVFIDGGACQGVFSLAASEIVGSHGQVVAVEPQQYAVDCLEENISLNNMTNISVHAAALYQSNGVIDMLSQGKVYASINDGSIKSPRQTYLERENRIEVPTVTIDTISKQIGRDVDLIKYNINGAEAASLRGAMHTIKRCKPTIAVVMYMTDYHDFQEYCDILMPCGYMPHVIHDEAIKPLDLKATPENNVIFIHNSKEQLIYDQFGR